MFPFHEREKSHLTSSTLHRRRVCNDLSLLLLKARVHIKKISVASLGRKRLSQQQPSRLGCNFLPIPDCQRSTGFGRLILVRIPRTVRSWFIIDTPHRKSFHNLHLRLVVEYLSGLVCKRQPCREIYFLFFFIATIRLLLFRVLRLGRTFWFVFRGMEMRGIEPLTPCLQSRCSPS